MPTIRPMRSSAWSMGTRPKPKVPVGPVTATVSGAEVGTLRRYPGAVVPRRRPGSSGPPLRPPGDRGRMSKHLLNCAGAGVAAVVLAVAAYAAGSSKDSSTSAAAGGRAAAAGQVAPNGQAPPGAPGPGTAVTGAAAAKAKAAALARHPGTVEAVVRLGDGSYVVHVITSGGELHVAVSKAFRVTGVQQGGPPAGASGTPPSGTAPPAGGTPPATGGSSAGGSTT